MKSTKHVFLLLFLYFGLHDVIYAKNDFLIKDNTMTYELSMPEPNNHYFEVKMIVEVNDASKDYLDFKMAAWTPGSYLIREYAKNVEGFEAKSSGVKIKYQKISKNTWRVFRGKSQKVEVNYRLYAFEMSVRNAHLDDSHGYTNGAAVFMYVLEKMKTKAILKVIPHSSFKIVSVALPEVAKFTYEVENFDLLVDSPIEIGNQDILEFESMGVKHTIANYSLQPLNYNKVQLISDYKKVVEASATVFGGKHPCKNYLFIVHHLPGIGGGLEHQNSTTCHTSPDAYDSRDKFIGFMGLIAHEYFHLWNVKRLRPVALGPFDYENENYTNMLWVSEGFTSYYQHDILRRAGFIDENKMLSQISYGINSTENTYGNKVQSVAEASWDAWIKYYRPNENSNNSTVSYYTKGGVIANILNMLIIGKTNGEKSLDDVLRLLCKQTYEAKKMGYTDSEFKKACETVSKTDLTQFFENCIYGTEMIDYPKYFEYVDMKAAIVESNPSIPWLGMTLRGKTVTRLERGSTTYNNGINVNDEIVKIDGIPFVSLEASLLNKKVGESLNVEVIRSAVLREFTIPLQANPNKSIRLTYNNSENESLRKNYKKWMHL